MVPGLALMGVGGFKGLALNGERSVPKGLAMNRGWAISDKGLALKSSFEWLVNDFKGPAVNQEFVVLAVCRGI